SPIAFFVQHVYLKRKAVRRLLLGCCWRGQFLRDESSTTTGRSKTGMLEEAAGETLSLGQQNKKRRPFKKARHAKRGGRYSLFRQFIEFETTKHACQFTGVAMGARGGGLSSSALTNIVNS
ncbi:unnamed protein product, partial [Ectocarpus sp. 12 AP-2014]